MGDSRVRAGLLRSSQRSFEKITNFTAAKITVQRTLDGNVDRDSQRKADDARRRRLFKIIDEGRIKKESDKWDRNDKAVEPLRDRMHDLEQKLGELSKGELFDGRTGLECMRIVDLRDLAHKLHSDEFAATLTEAVKVHRDFYLRYYDIENLADISANEDQSMHKVALMCRWLGIRSDRATEVPATFFD
jgi:hypothetical protein